MRSTVYDFACVCACVLSFCFPDVKQSSFKDAALKQKDKLDTNTGEVILRFPDGVDESAILHDLTSAKHNLKTIFNHHKLKFISVQKGSIKFRFTLPGQSDTFDSLAMERRIREFVRDLCSYESFRQLTKREDVQLEFVCKAKLDTISGIAVKIGGQSRVVFSLSLSACLMITLVFFFPLLSAPILSI